MCTIRYNTQFSCTYNFANDSIQDIAYKHDMLMAFRLEDFDDDVINTQTKALYDRFIIDPLWRDCMQRAARSFMSEDTYVGFMVLFAYDHFHYTHECISLALTERPYAAELQDLYTLLDKDDSNNRIDGADENGLNGG